MDEVGRGWKAEGHGSSGEEYNQTAKLQCMQI